MKKIFVLISLLALSNLMCLFSAYDIDQENFTKIAPKPSEFAGKYVPTKVTVTLITETGHYDLKDSLIELFSDGTLEMKNMPDWWLTPYGDSNGRLDSAKGTWELTNWGENWRVTLDFEPGGTFQEYSKDGFFTFKEISGDRPPYSIWFYIGDPDHGRVMIYEQVMEKP
jgi:hypothetical protein